MTFLERPRFHVLGGDRDVTERCDQITFSATDDGGFEIATLGLPSSDRPKKGTPVTIRAGLEVAWYGRVAEIADHSQHGRATKTTGCEGYRALMRDNPFRMIYVDRDFNNWQGPSVQRQINFASSSIDVEGAAVSADATTGAPALATSFSFPTSREHISEGWYDARGIPIASLYYAWKINADVNNADTNWQWFAFLAPDDVGSATDSSGQLRAAGPGSGTLTATTGSRTFALVEFLYAIANNANQGVIPAAYWTVLAVYGNHGLTKRGTNSFTTAQGFYPSDVARHALSQCAGISAGRIDDATGFIIPHCVYMDPTAPDMIVDDMAKLMGWTWGVWEPANLFNTQPRLDFRAPPPDATAVVTKAECDQLDVTSRLGDLYNVAQVTYTDVSGVNRVATTTLANPQLIEAGIGTRTLVLNFGQGDAASATTFGQFALALSQIAARAAGQATLPTYVRLPNGGHKPACLLRPGIDRLRIIDLQDGGPLMDLGTNRRDVFRISRVETTVAKDGSTSTRVELDNGTNLLEVLQARLQTTVGFGASGG